MFNKDQINEIQEIVKNTQVNAETCAKRCEEEGNLELATAFGQLENLAMALSLLIDLED